MPLEDVKIPKHLKTSMGDCSRLKTRQTSRPQDLQEISRTGSRSLSRRFKLQKLKTSRHLEISELSGILLKIEDASNLKVSRNIKKRFKTAGFQDAQASRPCRYFKIKISRLQELKTSGRLEIQDLSWILLKNEDVSRRVKNPQDRRHSRRVKLKTPRFKLLKTSQGFKTSRTCSRPLAFKMLKTQDLKTLKTLKSSRRLKT
jgi:hypothetical protein